MADPGRQAQHILVVNDSEEIIDLYRDIIEGMGHRVSATTYAPEDLHEVKRVMPDLVILDLMVDGNTDAGWQLLQKMKMERSTAGIPVVVCTAAVQAVREQEGWLAAKGTKVVLKPFDVEELELAIDKAFELPKLVTPPGDPAAIQ